MPKKFDRLEKRIEKEYIKKGKSRKKARSIGFATAGIILRKRKKK